MRSVLAVFVATSVLCSSLLAASEEPRGSEAALEPGEAVWVVGEATVFAHDIPTDVAKEECLVRARNDAIQKAVGVRIVASQSDFVREAGGEVFEHYSRLVTVDAYGHIIEEEPPLWSRRFGEDDTPIYSCTLRAKVQASGEPDPSFWVDVRLDRETGAYREGDEVVLTVEAGKDCYLHLFNIYSSGVVRVLTPSGPIPARRLEARVPVEIPSEEERESGFHLRPGLMDGRESDREEVIAVVTLDDRPLRCPQMTEGTAAVASLPETDFVSMSRWLAGIDSERRASDVEGYSVFR